MELIAGCALNGRLPASLLTILAGHFALAAFGTFRPLEERILHELLLDVGGELEVRHLQQLDRLLQLRRHHQRLGLPKIEARGDCHDAVSGS